MSIPRDIKLQIVSPAAEPPKGEGWLHEVKHDGHHLLAIVAEGTLKLLSRNGRDRTALFGEAFKPHALTGRSHARSHRALRRRNDRI